MTKTELTAVVHAGLKGLSSKFVTDDYDNAISDAERDTGWAEPYSGNFKEEWMIKRTKRHLFFYLMTEALKDFKYKQINLQQRFEHYRLIVQDMDKEFEAAVENNPHEFAGVGVHEMFGHKVDAGFASAPQTGRDITYDSDQRVIVTPSENS